VESIVKVERVSWIRLLLRKLCEGFESSMGDCEEACCTRIVDLM
jgi:hypothetical protein